MQLTLPAVPESVPEARHAVVAVAERAGAPARVVADVALAVSEACTNVVLHAYREAEQPGTIGVSAEVTDDGLLEVVVHDQGSGLGERSDSPGLGMGLALMAAVATSFELDHDGAATRVHLSFCLRGDAEAPADAEPDAAPERVSTDRD